jgi:hypothetical protein
MELNYDWRCFQNLFQPRRAKAALGVECDGPIFVAIDKDTIVSAYAESEDLSDWIGAGVTEIKTGMPNREIVTLDREKLDLWFSQGLELPHLYEQVEHYRSQASPKKAGLKLINRKHFLLDAIESWWGKVLPSAYGIYIRFEGTPESSQEFFFLIRRGKLELFHEPDLSAIGPERKKVHSQAVKYLSEKHAVPVQGIFLSEKDWVEASQSDQPWKEVARAVRANRVKMVPFRWTLATLMASRAFLEI